MGLNTRLLGGSVDYWSEEDEVFEATTNLVIRGAFYEPAERTGDGLGITIFGQRASWPRLRVKDIHARDNNDIRLYRTRRGISSPVLNLPPGVCTIERRRSAQHCRQQRL